MMNTKAITANVLAAAVIGGSLVAPIASLAQNSRARASHHRQGTKNGWRNGAYIAGAAGLYGLATHNTTMSVLGLGGAAYSASRYEHDRKSQSRIDRSRAEYYRRHYMHRRHRNNG